MDHVVVDVEIQRTIKETPGGWNATDKLGVAVACVWNYQTARMRVYGPNDVEALRERLLIADRISGFNIFNFDFPVIWGVSKKHWLGDCVDVPNDQAWVELHETKKLLTSKTDDMLRRIWQAKGLNPDRFHPSTHGGVGLDAVASATIGAKKIGFGGDAPEWFQAGLIQKVVNYCADDVAMERDLTDFVDRYGYVVIHTQDTADRWVDGSKQDVIVTGKILTIPKWIGGA